MWTELKYCREGDLIRAYFLGDSDIESPSNHNWHQIYAMEDKGNGDYYAAIEGYKGTILPGRSDVYKKD